MIDLVNPGLLIGIFYLNELQTFILVCCLISVNQFIQMKKLFLVAISITALFSACQSNTKEKTTSDTVAVSNTEIVPATQQQCYQYIKNGDTAIITMMSSGPITTGELNYSLAEKDSNKGIFEGELHGDTLIAEYTFNSEGRESVRQVAFLKKGDQLLEGFGDVEERKGKTMFKNTATLKFGESIVFSKIDCN